MTKSIFVIREIGWHCCQFDVIAEKNQHCIQREIKGCRGCKYAVWETSLKVQAKDVIPEVSEAIQ